MLWLRVLRCHYKKCPHTMLILQRSCRGSKALIAGIVIMPCKDLKNAHGVLRQALNMLSIGMQLYGVVRIQSA